jgi:putative tryptophan/tyrosine transport system substrate-binding protein
MKPMPKEILAACLAVLVLSSGYLVEAQQAKVYRIGVIHEGGPTRAVIDGLKDGLRELGFEEGKQYVLKVHDLQGDRTAAAEAARTLEGEKVDLLFAFSTSVTTVAKRATSKVPIVFFVGEDPVVAGLVESFARPGGRLTGVYNQQADLTAKRLQILKLILPDLRKAVTFYDPSNGSARVAAKVAREAAGQLGIELVERHVASVEDLRLGIAALKAQDSDAYFYINDAMVTSQAQFIIDTTTAKKLPTIFANPLLVRQGALVSYGVSFHEIGRVSAKYVQRILSGADPQDLPVESISRVELAINLKTARQIGVAIPQELRLRADELIE